MWQRFISKFREGVNDHQGARSPSPPLEVTYVSGVNKCSWTISPTQSLPPSCARFMLSRPTITSLLPSNRQIWVKWIAFCSILLTETSNFFLVDTTWKLGASTLATHWLPAIRDTYSLVRDVGVLASPRRSSNMSGTISPPIGGNRTGCMWIK